MNGIYLVSPEIQVLDRLFNHFFYKNSAILSLKFQRFSQILHMIAIFYLSS